MKNPKTLAIVIGAVALVLIGFLFFKSPKPIIEIKAETITDIGHVPHIFVTGDAKTVRSLKPNATVMQKPYFELDLVLAIQSALNMAKAP